MLNRLFDMITLQGSSAAARREASDLIEGFSKVADRESRRQERQAAVVNVNAFFTACLARLTRARGGLRSAAAASFLVQRCGPQLPATELARLAGVRYLAALENGGVARKPGLLNLIRFLETRRVPKAVATSTRTELATKMLRGANVLKHFSIVVGGDQVERGKPAPDIFLAAAHRLGRSPEECVVLEDSDPGVQAAASAGIRTILIPDLYEPSAIARSNAYAVVQSLIEARRMVEEMLPPGH